MPRHPLLGTTSLTLAAFAGTGALADVTPADVWDSYVSYYEATGATVNGTLEADGDAMVVRNNGLTYVLPFGIATIRLDMPEMRLTGQGDGTVAITYPETFDLALSMDVPEQGAGDATIAVTQTGHVGTASGDPGNVTFSHSADSLRAEAKELNIPDIDVDFVMQVLSQGYDLTSTVTTGDLITVDTDMALETADIAYVISTPDGAVVSNTGQFGRTTSESQMALPAGGSDVLNLSAALQAGAYLRGTSSSESNTSETITTFDNQVVSEQSSTSGQTDTRFSVDAAGLDLFVEAASSTFTALMPDMLPFPIEGSLGAATVGYKFPLLPSEEPQDVGLRVGLSDLVISDGLWNIFDPAGELPRDPASLNIDVAGSVISGIDLLNFATLESQFNQAVPPITAESVTINDLSVSAVGASAKASGAFTLDMTDMETFPGFPRPTGDAILEVSGANTLIDRLVNMGLIGPDEAGMARLSMGFIARATGDDRFETVVAVTEDGQVMVNGQRMR